MANSRARRVGGAAAEWVLMAMLSALLVALSPALAQEAVSFRSTVL
jgi:hypothetical protein